MIYRDCRNNTKIIRDLREIGPRSVLFYGHQDGAIFTLPNTEERAIVKALTTAIIAGGVKIDGEFDCVNSLYTRSSTNAASFTAESPVPTCTSEDVILTGKFGRVRVTRGAASWYIWEAHFGHPHDTDELSSNRIGYICVVDLEKNIFAYRRVPGVILRNKFSTHTAVGQMETHGLFALEEPGHLFSFRKGEKTYKISMRSKSLLRIQILRSPKLNWCRQGEQRLIMW